MDQSANLQLPYIMPSQAQKHVTHNEAIRMLDALLHLAVIDRNMAVPPASPQDGDRYLVAESGSGAWSGQDDRVAAWQDGAWAFFAPRAGWVLWIADEERLVSFDGAAWIDAAVHSVNPSPLVGVSATADATNRLAVKSPASLFDEEAGDHRLKINKAAAADTASLVFQSGYSGRAEFGLTGDDDWHVKVSPDGGSWMEVLHVDRLTGRVRLPSALELVDANQVVVASHVREKLSADRTYYVRKDGSDANNGLVDHADGAFLTIARAISAATSLDLSIYDVMIQLEDTAWDEAVSVTLSWVGQGTVWLRGGSNACSLTAATAVSVSDGARLALSDITFASTSVGLSVNSGGYAALGAGIVWAGSGAAHMRATSGHIIATAPYAIVSAPQRHILATLGGSVTMSSLAHSISGSMNFTVVFAQADRLAFLSVAGCSFTGGTVTGKRYDVSSNAVIQTGGGGGGFFPGSIAGSTGSGGQYG